ncbi:MAG: ABC transporter substrate-binding protein, partial [Planctomycetaceae bacterium]
MFLLLIAAASSAGCIGESPQSRTSGQAEGQPREPVKLLLNWYPEAEHGGYYAAAVHGYYAEAGLDVQIIAGGPNSPVLERVAGGSVSFGIENADRVLLGRAAQADVVAVMAPIQTSPRCVMVHAATGIRSFDQLTNLTLAISSSAAWAEFLKKNASLRDVRIVPYSGNVAPFLLEERFAQQAYVFSEPYLAEQRGADPHCLMVSDLGYNPYTSVLVTNRKRIESSPEVVEKMVEATIRGWRTYLESPDETNKHIGQLNPQMDQGSLAYGARALKPLCMTDAVPADRLGEMTEKRWRQL